MPDLSAHDAKARDNEQFADWLLSIQSRHTDWIATALSYAALHHVQQLLHHLGVSDEESGTHVKRRDLLKREPRLRTEVQLQNDHFGLQDESRDARYECVEFTLDRARQLREQFARVKARVHHLMA